MFSCASKQAVGGGDNFYAPFSCVLVGELCAWAEEVITKHEKKVGVLQERHPQGPTHHSDISVLENNVQGRTNAPTAQQQKEVSHRVGLYPK